MLQMSSRGSIEYVPNTRRSEASILFLTSLIDEPKTSGMSPWERKVGERGVEQLETVPRFQFIIN